MVEFTPEKLERLKKAYAACQSDSFHFDGCEYLKSYAKYLIEYLDLEFKKRG